MLKKKIVLSLCLIITLLSMSLNVFASGELVSDRILSVTSSGYISPTFTPTIDNNINVRIAPQNSYSGLLYYVLQTYTNGSWVDVQSQYVINSGSSISRGYIITIGSQYRVKITSMNSTTIKMWFGVDA